MSSSIVGSGESATLSDTADPTDADPEFDPDFDAEFDAAVDPESDADGECDWEGEFGECDAESACTGGVTHPALGARPATATDEPASPLMNVRRFVADVPLRPEAPGSRASAGSPPAELVSTIGSERTNRSMVGTPIARGSRYLAHEHTLMNYHVEPERHLTK